ncbi:glycosyltransferase family 4 protein [Leptolyngbya sp. FACHB-261]|uniref:glycosyltransferase family 4 protein n=1 Tax=Leptolyngbya sp. FACHB-261 TaxID=2692806 RepID=UPI00168889B4|nr:glycosyltransferase family 4 protein [Leptolyngbya sp. FACHB-261]MBD2105160.1 glycosyltransferase family 4 protein [Leptolyngbya sp. FACHB-261]
MKPKILHLLGDDKMGGVKSTVENLKNSRLAEQFEFSTSPIETARAAISNLKPDLILCHQACNWKGLVDLLLVRLLHRRTKIVIYEHHYSAGFERFNVPSVARFRLMLKLSHALAHRVVAISQAQQKWLNANNLVAQKKLDLIQPCCNLDNFLQLSPKPSNQLLTLATYGRFCTQKGFDILLDAMRLIPQAPIRLRIAGTGPDEAKLKKAAQGLDNVQFVGRIDDVAQFLQSCDAVIVPSRWEPWGIVCLEAKAASKALIVADVDGLSEQIQDCGLAVPSLDSQELAQAIASLLSQNLEAWGEAGRKSVKHAWEKYLEQWENLFWRVIGF